MTSRSSFNYNRPIDGSGLRGGGVGGRAANPNAPWTDRQRDLYRKIIAKKEEIETNRRDLERLEDDLSVLADDLVGTGMKRSAVASVMCVSPGYLSNLIVRAETARALRKMEEATNDPTERQGDGG